MNPADVMTILGAPAGSYPRDAVQAAMDNGEELVPLLLMELESVRRDPRPYIEQKSGSFLPIHALELLGYHRVPEAHAHMIALAGLPGEMPFDLFGDAVHELLPKALWKTSGGDPSGIIGLVRNREANEYCRSSAISALLLGVEEQRLTREELLEFLHGLFTGEEADFKNPMVWNAAASALADLWPGESLDVLRKAYEDELIEPGFICFDDIERHLEPGKEAAMALLAESGLAKLNRSPHDEISWWAAFRDNSTRDSKPAAEAQKRRKDRRRAKAKRKQSRVARKKARAGKKRK